ncbi:MAG TPA: hypothetical protein ENI51_09925 [Candidatus Atribacteria bacterium]|nr:hypothetical protein [Candidatus Atribacteria bacterium]
MKPLNILGLIVFSGGIFILVGFGLYKFFENTEIPQPVRWGIITLILGIVIILISLIKERLKEKN